MMIIMLMVKTYQTLAVFFEGLPTLASHYPDHHEFDNGSNDQSLAVKMMMITIMMMMSMIIITMMMMKKMIQL